MTRHVFYAAVTLIAAAVLAGTVSADAVYHTERLELRGLSAPGGGAVVNIHPNGPNVYTHQLYTLRHAVPGTYLVFMNPCVVGSGPRPIVTAILTTNASGNGHADVKLMRSDVPFFGGTTACISWTLDGPATYVTDSTVVTLD